MFHRAGNCKQCFTEQRVNWKQYFTEQAVASNVSQQAVASNVSQQAVASNVSEIRQWDTMFQREGSSKECFKKQAVANNILQVVMDAHMGSNQSGAEKDNRLLFGEQWILSFSKSKIAPWKIGPIRSRIKNSRWRRPRKSAMLENSPPASTEDWDRSHGFPWRQKLRQGHAKNVTQFQIRYLQCPVVLNDSGPSGMWPDWETWARI